MIYLDLSPADYAAGDLGSYVPGRLRFEIIRIAVDDYGSANDVLYSESAFSHRHLCASLLHHQRRQITSVSGMDGAVGIIMIARQREVCTDTAVSLMNMNPKKPLSLF